MAVFVCYGYMFLSNVNDMNIYPLPMGIMPNGNLNKHRRLCYGCMEIRVQGERIIGCNGGFEGVSAALAMYMHSGYTLAVLSNYDHGVMGVHLREHHDNRLPHRHVYDCCE